MVNTGIKYTTNFVTSKDGTKIHYRQIGSGEGLVLVHGGMMYSENFMRLAKMMSDNFTVYIPDRSGHGLSETRKEHSLLAEGEDIQALLKQTNSHYIFGLSAGAIVVLQTAILNSSLKKIALYEPPLFIDSTSAHLNKIIENYNRAMAKQNYGRAFISVVKGTGDDGSLFKIMPCFITTPLMNVAINLDAKKKFDENKVPLKSLITATQYDNQIALQSQRIIDKVKNINPEILLLGGNKSHSFLKEALDKLNSELPKAKRITLPNVGHIASHNEGKPQLVANELIKYFKQNN